MDNKQYAVLGLGIFGSTVATTLANHGCEVIVIDKDSICVQRIADEVTKAIVGDVTDIEELQAAGIGDSDVAIVAIGTHLEEAVLATMNLKELGIPYVIAKAKLGNEGSVAYQYDTMSVVSFKGLDEEAVLDALVMAEIDARDIISEDDGSIKVIGEPSDLNKIKEAIEGVKADVEFDIDEIQTVPQETVELEGEDMELFERLMNNLNDCDDVDHIYHNVANYDEGE